MITMMFKMTIFPILIVVIFAFSSVKAQMLICQEKSFEKNDGLCGCQNGEFYNAYEGKCQNVCSYFGNHLCGYHANAQCINDDKNATQYVCGCPSGFKPSDSSEELICIDKNECVAPAGDCEDPNAECVDLYGTYGCTCKITYFRNQNGTCQKIDMCNEPDVERCSHLCTMDYESNNYSCSCFLGYEMNTNGECVLAPDFEACECGSNPEWTVCAKYTGGGGTIICEPKQGYQFQSGTEVVEDINECENETLYQCIRGSQCVNLNGSYSCECPIDYYWNNTFNECFKKECPPGFVLYEHSCQEFCGKEIGPYCPCGTACLVDSNNIASCECKLGCQIGGCADSNLSLSVYSVSFVTPYKTILTPEDDLYATDLFLVTKSMESIFGKGNAEIIDYVGSYNGTWIEVAVGLSKPVVSLKDLEAIILFSCWPLVDPKNGVEKCVLPQGITIVTNSINAATLSIISTTTEENVNPLTEMRVDHYDYKCAEVYETATKLQDFYCKVLNECNTKITGNPHEAICKNLIDSYRCS